MSSSVFRQIGSGSRPARAERLFRAAITAFCALTRPSRAEIAQLDDLTLSLLPHVPSPALRFAAAALSENVSAPPHLVRRLCDQDIDIAAPLLARSPILEDADLLGLMERHGLSHARVIARRQAIAPAVADAIEALLVPSSLPAAGSGSAASAPNEPAENARRRLRGMMRGAPDAASPARDAVKSGYEVLRDTALLDHRPFFHTALADALGVPLGEAKRIANDPPDLLAALHGLGLQPEQAFLIVAAGSPEAVQDRSDIQAVLDCFAELEAAALQDTPSAQADGPSADAPPSASAVFRFKRA